MKSEEKLNQLFESLRSEKASTSVSDITSWIDATPQLTISRSPQKLIFKKSLIVLSSVTTACIIGGLLLFYVNKGVTFKPKNDYHKQKRQADSTKITPDPDNQLNFKNEPSLKPIINTLIDLALGAAPLIETASTREAFLLDSSASYDGLVDLSSQKNGSWISSYDSLRVDTLFRGVKVLVFKGNRSDVLVQGTLDTDLTMSYYYRLDAKGYRPIKDDKNCVLSYLLKDSVLTVNLERIDKKCEGTNGFNEQSKISFYIPDNMDVKVDSDFGDMEVNGLKNKSTILHTSLGDITSINLKGVFDFVTDLGDISVYNATGKIKCFTSIGDITAKNMNGAIEFTADIGNIAINDLTGKIKCHVSNGNVSGGNITVNEECALASSIGNISVQLNNPFSECRLNLSTDMGKVKVYRPKFKQKSTNQLVIGNGRHNIKIETSIGKIKVR